MHGFAYLRELVRLRRAPVGNGDLAALGVVSVFWGALAVGTLRYFL